jgi:hypothetical protein
MRKVFLLALPLLALLPLAAHADDSIVKFDGGIGVIPVSNVTVASGIVTVIPNAVRGVDPAGQIWVISDLRADVRADGIIRVDGRGLLLGGGNNIGGNAGANVFATLICAVPMGFTQHSTNLTGVPLGLDGDFRIDDLLSPAPPADCASPVLLIRNAANQGWFAAGIVKR